MILLIIFAINLISLSLCQVKKINQTAFYTQFNPKVSMEIESGYVTATVNSTQKGSFFYQLFYMQGQNNENLNTSEPLIIILNRKPGDASQQAIFSNIGPFDISYSGNGYNITNQNPLYSWNSFAHMLFVDQPFGLGFSYSDQSESLPRYVNDAADFFIQFILEFYNVNPQFLLNPLYIYGVSFSGQFIPTFGRRLLKNEAFKKLGVNFTAVAIGGAWINPELQISFYSSYLYSAGLVDNLRRDDSLRIVTGIQQSILEGDYSNARDQIYSFQYGYFDKYIGNLSIYNINNLETKTSAKDIAIQFFNDYKKDFQVPDQVFYQHQNNFIQNQFGQDVQQSRETDLIYLLDKQIRVLIYNGQQDFIVNTAGLLNFLNQMKWSKTNIWKTSTKTFLEIGPQTKGWYMELDNFRFSTIYNAGHISSDDQPQIVQQLIKELVGKGEKKQ